MQRRQELIESAYVGQAPAIRNEGNFPDNGGQLISQSPGVRAGLRLPTSEGYRRYPGHIRPPGITSGIRNSFTPRLSNQGPRMAGPDVGVTAGRAPQSTPNLTIQAGSANSTNMNALVQLNVGGTRYTSILSTLTRYPDSKLGRLLYGALPIVRDSRNYYFIDRDGQLFRYILNYLRTGRLILPKNFTELHMLRDEAHFLGLQDMVKDIVDYVYSSSHESSSDSENSSTNAVAEAVIVPKLVLETEPKPEPMEIEDKGANNGKKDQKSTENLIDL